MELVGRSAVVIGSGGSMADKGSSANLQLIHPNIFANAALTVVKVPGAGFVRRVTEIDGVGFAVLSTTTEATANFSGGIKYSAARLNLFDFDGRLETRPQNATQQPVDLDLSPYWLETSRIGRAS